MKFKSGAAAVALCFCTSGCASIIGGGTSQEIAVMTTPPGASCVFYREDQPIGTIPATPGNLVVKRRKYDIVIKCDKPGYKQAEYLNHSGLSSMVAGNIAADLILTAGISSIIDSANGADNEYTGTVIIGLDPIQPANAPAPPPSPTPPPPPATPPAAASPGN